ncbi:DUF1104 domain-containing protein [Arcobacter sp. LA11]|uniref:DUF1104 domain-containing protein n=1 Tax=Arcobacter sp. LA11 TaxID=1898176 RepID=UPI000933C316|nr:DUF1104 domain-containing protein [Arcobacter sp. LA11]
MRKILTIFLITLFFSPLFAVDYTEMSTQELIAIMGYVEKKNEKKFKNELKQRVPTMNPTEKAKYEQNLEKLKNK